MIAHTILPMRRGDGRECFAVFAAALAAIPASIYAPKLVDRWVQTEGADRMDRYAENGFVALAPRGKIIGFGAAQYGLLLALYCHPAQQRQGVASALLRRLEARLAAHGNRESKVLASLAALPFYERHGYQKIWFTNAIAGLPCWKMARILGAEIIRERNSRAIGE